MIVHSASGVKGGGAVPDPSAIDMCGTCSHARDMSVTVQIRNVPNELHGRLKARAALAGMSLSEYLLHEIRRAAERPSVEELRARLQGRAVVAPSTPPARAVRAERDGR
jgi:plasmid stability protein